MSKNILVNYLGRKGGTALYSFEMAKGLIENGANVYGIISEQNYMLNEWKKLKFKKLLVLPTYNNNKTFIINTVKFFIKYRFIIKNFFKDVKIDVVYVPAFHNWGELVNNIFPKAKKIVTTHDALPHTGNLIRNKLTWIYNKKSLKNADDIIILSEYFKKYMIDIHNKSEKNIHVIPHGVFNYYNSIKIYNESLYDKETINFLFFGRIEDYKGLSILSKAYKKVSEKYKKVSLTIAGSGDFSKYEKEYKSLRNVHIINRWIDDTEVGNFFCGNNIITVLPYLNATQSGVINIAMINKSLVIATSCSGIVEQICHKQTGILIKPNDINALVKAMEFVIENRNDCNKYIENASKYIESLSWKKLSKKVLKIVEQY